MQQYIPVATAALIVLVGVVYTLFPTPSITAKKDDVNIKESKVISKEKSKKTTNEKQTKAVAFKLPNEAQIIKKSHFLLLLREYKMDERMKELCESFCGTVISDSSQLPNLTKKETVYLCGDISKVSTDIKTKLNLAGKVFIIQEVSTGSTNDMPEAWRIVCLGRVPFLVHGVGILYRNFFGDEENDYFNRIRAQHAFQSLTESTKPGTALRTGIYLTPVHQVKDETHFNLLRCSTNLDGPTGNFQSTDIDIVNALNEESNQIFENPAPLNHVLAQIYRNKPAVGVHKQTKAKIKEHSDKTKDMPLNGVMAFVTFYEQLDKLNKIGDYDYGIKTTSGLTRLVFRLKREVILAPGGDQYEKKFSVTLSPNSVFFMPLSTNRLYTHEIVPSNLEASLLPTRMGYVVRCSNTGAVFKDNATFLNNDESETVAVSAGTKAGDNASASEAKESSFSSNTEKWVKMEEPTREGMTKLRTNYHDENTSASWIDYGSNLFSMNKGDYQKPFYDEHSEFRIFSIFNSKKKDNENMNLFRELMESAPFEYAGKGRQGAVLVKPRESDGGIPIVRTTTKYKKPSHCFRDVHQKIANEIERIGGISLAFNNALIENYVNEYATMGYHSDQALDLADGSSIALFTCYEYPELVEELVRPPRMLVVQPKVEEGGGGGSHKTPIEIPLPHNSVVLFSVDCNRKFKHKIVLDTNHYQPDNTWLGVTFRTSKTFIKYDEEKGKDGEPIIAPRFVDDSDSLSKEDTPFPLLTLVTVDEKKEFYSLRSTENSEVDFTYPEHLTYTISGSDLLRPT